LRSLVCSQAVLEIGDTVTATVVSMDKMWVELSADGSTSDIKQGYVAVDKFSRIAFQAVHVSIASFQSLSQDVCRDAILMIST